MSRPVFFVHQSGSGGTSLCKWAQEQPCSRIPACGANWYVQHTRSIHLATSHDACCCACMTATSTVSIRGIGKRRAVRQRAQCHSSSAAHRIGLVVKGYPDTLVGAT